MAQKNREVPRTSSKGGQKSNLRFGLCSDWPSNNNSVLKSENSKAYADKFPGSN